MTMNEPIEVRNNSWNAVWSVLRHPDDQSLVENYYLEKVAPIPTVADVVVSLPASFVAVAPILVPVGL